MWVCRPRKSQVRTAPLRARKHPRARSSPMPNLFRLFPVEMYLWVFASTSGFTRMATGAFLSSRSAIALMRSSSGSLSTLKQWMPARNASAISSSVFPTPANVQEPARPPAFKTRKSSPPETMSNAAPSLAEQAQDGQVRASLHGIADHVIQEAAGPRRAGESCSGSFRPNRRRLASRFGRPVSQDSRPRSGESVAVRKRMHWP